MLDNLDNNRTAQEAHNQSNKKDPGAAARPALLGSDYLKFDPSPEALVPGEPWWRDHYQWLKDSGYLLRPRYDPAWVPSWIGTKKDWYTCEDGTVAWFSNLMDATRLSDGSYVGLKQISKHVHPYETDIGLFFSSQSLLSEPSNHCIPVYEVLQVPDDEDLIILVMPFLRPYDDPRFDTVGEVMECYGQVLEGLQFMHKHRVAHRDCTGGNVMMDATRMYPESHHPWKQAYTRDYRRKAKHYTRTQRPPKYYLIDFGLSRHYSADEVAPREDPIWGGDKTVPEFQKSNDPCDPFPTDIYYIGNMMKEDCVETMVGFDFLNPLIADMTQADPTKRPTIDESVARFEAIRDGLTVRKLRTRVVLRDDNYILGFFRGVAYWTRRVSFTLRRVPPMPSV